MEMRDPRRFFGLLTLVLLLRSPARRSIRLTVRCVYALPLACVRAPSLTRRVTAPGHIDVSLLTPYSRHTSDGRSARRHGTLTLTLTLTPDPDTGTAVALASREAAARRVTPPTPGQAWRLNSWCARATATPASYAVLKPMHARQVTRGEDERIGMITWRWAWHGHAALSAYHQPST